MNRLIVMLCLTLTASACVSIPTELTSEAAFSPTTPMQAQNGEHDGEWVRWGGVIIKTTPKPDQTCFEMMGLPLDSNAEPENDDQITGRFIACANGFYEPAVYDAGRAITFVGYIDGTEQQKIGEYEYKFPHLDVDALRLWPKRSDVVYVPYYDPRWDPFWDPFWPYYYRPHHHLR